MKTIKLIFFLYCVSFQTLYIKILFIDNSSIITPLTIVRFYFFPSAKPHTSIWKFFMDCSHFRNFLLIVYNRLPYVGIRYGLFRFRIRFIFLNIIFENKTTNIWRFWCCFCEVSKAKIYLSFLLILSYQFYISVKKSKVSISMYCGQEREIIVLDTCLSFYPCGVIHPFIRVLLWSHTSIHTNMHTCIRTFTYKHSHVY